jgi:hypothetical protein
VIPVEIDVHGSTLIQPAGGVWSARDSRSPIGQRVPEVSPFALQHGIDVRGAFAE